MPDKEGTRISLYTCSGIFASVCASPTWDGTASSPAQVPPEERPGFSGRPWSCPTWLSPLGVLG